MSTPPHHSQLREFPTMFAPITAPTFIQTVHGLTYKVVRTLQREENEDPQQSKKSNLFDAVQKSTSEKNSSDSRLA